jgi:predicted phage terminase large subunit-like protein
MTVQTDALDVIDKALVGVDEAVGVMMRRRMLIARLRRSGMGDVEARDRATLEIPSQGITRLIISMPPQEGKLIAHDEPVPTPLGWRNHGDLHPGDYVYSPSGRAIKVLAISHDGIADMRVTTTDGASIVCHENHEWTINDRSSGKWKTVETGYLAGRTLHSGPKGKRGGRYICSLPFYDAIDGVRTELPMDPYTIGMWLGDGSTSKGAITHHVDDVYDFPYEISSHYVHPTTGVITDYFVGMWADLKSAGVANNKHIPEAYLWADRQSRFDLLCGLIDSDGSIDPGGQVLFANANALLASQTAQLIRSLGYRVGERVVAPRTSSSGIVGKLPIHIVTYSPHDGVAPARLPRKVAKLKTSIIRRRVAIASVKRTTPRPGRCITVDSDDGLYLVGKHFTPTHNSERATRYGVLWMLRRWPDLRVAIISYGDRMAQEMSWKIRGDIETHNGEEGNVDTGLRLMKDSKAKGDWKLATGRGSVYATGIGGPLTGRPVEALFIDDPVKDAKGADSDIESSDAWLWWHAVGTTRLAPGAPVIVILTRWHESDLAGRLLSKQLEDEKSELEHFDRWHVINIAAQADYSPPEGDFDPYDFDPLGRQPGEFMSSARGRTQEQWETIKASKPPRIWSALYQGRPTPDTGDVFNRNWWVRFSTPIWTEQPDGSYEIHEATEVLMSWDMTFKGSNNSDFVVGQVWARKGAYAYLVDQVRARLTFTATVEAFERMCQRWPQASLKLVEDKANGAAVIDTLRRKIGGIVAVQVGAKEGSKESRAAAVSPFVQSNNVMIPDMSIAVPGFDPEAFIVECTQFPNGAHDDQVDAASQALSRIFIKGSGAKDWLESLAPLCVHCGKPNIKGSLKCEQCGEPIEQPEVKPEVAAAERVTEEFSLTSGMTPQNGNGIDPNQAVLDIIRQHSPGQFDPFNRNQSWRR